jgi:hypothetical protein
MLRVHGVPTLIWIKAALIRLEAAHSRLRPSARASASAIAPPPAGSALVARRAAGALDGLPARGG